jgi:hypothetical protein
MAGAFQRPQRQYPTFDPQNPWAGAVTGASKWFGPTQSTLDRAGNWETQNRQVSIQEQDALLRQQEAAQRQKAIDDYNKWLADFGAKLAAAGQGTPAIPGTPGSPAVTHPLNRPEFTSKLGAEDQALAAQAVASGQAKDTPAVAPTPGTPGTPGNPVLAGLAPLVQAGAPQGVLDTAFNAYSQNLQPGTPGFDNATATRILQTAHPKNIEAQKIKSMIAMGLQPTKEDWDRAYDYENMLRGYDVDWYNASTSAKKAGGGGADGFKLDDAALRTEYNSWLAKWPKENGQPPTFDEWIHGAYGEPTVLGYTQSTIGRKIPSTASQTYKNLPYTANQAYTENDWMAADKLIQNAPSKLGDPASKKGSIRNAIILALQKKISPAVVMALIDRYNRKNTKKMYLADWKKLAGVK